MIYIDTSSFLKLFIRESYSMETGVSVFEQERVIVTSLTLLEAHSNLRGLQLGGKLRRSAAERAKNTITQFLANKPFMVKHFPSKSFDRALAQHEQSSVHCRSLDRLHLAAMAELEVRRLMTHDSRQADAARELGHEVMMPGM